MRHGLGPIIGRLVAVIGGLLVLGIAFRLLMAILTPVLPAGLLAVLVAGWNILWGILAYAIAPITALVILAALIWVVVGRRR